MISESGPWKVALLKDAELIDRWARKKVVTERRSQILERKIFIAAFSMRKLFESKKLSSKHETRSVACERFQPQRNQHITRLNNHRLDEHYDLFAPHRTSVNLQELLDMIIHSFTFGEAIDDDDTVDGFFITSDRRRRLLWLIRICDFTSAMRRLGKDSRSKVVYLYDPATKDHAIWSGAGEPPAQFRVPIEMRQRASKRAKG